MWYDVVYSKVSLTAANTGCGVRQNGLDWKPAFAREAVLGKGPLRESI
jgi:hypothetical protein